MAFVPDPRVSAETWPEVSSANVVDLGGETEEATLAVRPVGFGGRLGETVLLRRAVQQVQGAVLDVDRLLHQWGVRDKIRCR